MPHNRLFPLNMYFILYSYIKINAHGNSTRCFPCAREESRILQNYLISQQVESQFFHSKTNPLSARISCIRSLKDIIRLHPAQLMTNHPDAWQVLPSNEALRGLWSVFYQDRPVLALTDPWIHTFIVRYTLCAFCLLSACCPEGKLIWVKSCCVRII